MTMAARFLTMVFLYMGPRTDKKMGRRMRARDAIVGQHSLNGPVARMHASPHGKLQFTYKESRSIERVASRKLINEKQGRIDAQVQRQQPGPGHWRRGFPGQSSVRTP